MSHALTRRAARYTDADGSAPSAARRVQCRRCGSFPVLHRNGSSDTGCAAGGARRRLVPEIPTYAVSPALKTMGIVMKEGREFGAGSRAGGR